jgi:hypothetical protein
VRLCEWCVCVGGSQAWFFERSTGSYTVGGSTVFWYGPPGAAPAPAAVARLLPHGPSSSSSPSSSSHGHGGHKLAGTNYTPTRKYAHAAAVTRRARVGVIGARGYVGQELMKVRCFYVSKRMPAHTHTHTRSLSLTHARTSTRA